MSSDRFSRGFLLLLVLGITALFVVMIRRFVMTILLAGIIAGLAAPLYRRLLAACRGRRALASGLSLFLLLIVVLLPCLAVLGIVAGEAIEISERVKPWVGEQLERPDRLLDRIQDIPGLDRLAPYRDDILSKAGDLVSRASSFLFSSVSSATRGTASFLLHFFILLYTLFFFLMDGSALLQRMLGYLPLDEDDKQRLVGKFASVARATLKGTLLIGLAQGILAGLAFALAGIQGAVFWGALMVVLSVIPGIGTGLVWAPAGVILLAMGRAGAGLFVLLFCGVIVSSVDNLLRPRLVGRDTQMHELLIFFGTVGGIALFGAPGFVLGPILSALLVTVWDIYGAAFQDLLPAGAALGGAAAGPAESPPEAARTDPSGSAQPRRWWRRRGR